MSFINKKKWMNKQYRLVIKMILRWKNWNQLSSMKRVNRWWKKRTLWRMDKSTISWRILMKNNSYQLITHCINLSLFFTPTISSQSWWQTTCREFSKKSITFKLWMNWTKCSKIGTSSTSTKSTIKPWSKWEGYNWCTAKSPKSMRVKKSKQMSSYLITARSKIIRHHFPIKSSNKFQNGTDFFLLELESIICSISPKLLRDFLVSNGKTSHQSCSKKSLILLPINEKMDKSSKSKVPPSISACLKNITSINNCSHSNSQVKDYLLI